MTTSVGAPQIQFLNHSCVKVMDGSASILCDPWFKGTAFDNGWRLLHEDSHDINQIACDAIWISHEHPDHFSVPTLKELKTKKRFVYQSSNDGKVSAYLKSKGHDVIEAGDQEEIILGDVACRLFVCDGYDSAMLFRFADGSTFLNVNDARIELGSTLEAIKKWAPAVDTLAIQFGYANWAGNAGDFEIPKDQHEMIMQRIELIQKALMPKQIILFASYVYCSHADNFYWNSHFWLDDTMEWLGKNIPARLVVPSPDQIIPVVSSMNEDFAELNKSAIAFWRRKHESLIPKDFNEESLSLVSLQEAYGSFYQSLWKNNDLELARKTGPGDFSLKVYLEDLSQAVEIGLFENRFAVLEGSEFDIKISTGTLRFLLRNAFGRGTICVNSKISFHYPAAHKFFVYFFIFYANNIGKYFRAGELSWKALASLQKVATLQSIFKFCPEAKMNFENCLKEFTAEQAQFAARRLVS